MKNNYYKFLKPENLFLIGTILANLPYVLWYFNLMPKWGYSFSITYKPTLVWLVGYFSFWFGAKLFDSVSPRTFLNKGRKFKVNYFLLFNLQIFLLLLLIVQLLFVIRSYGGIPILLFTIKNSYNINQVNSLQHEFGFGQLGLLTLTTFLLNALLLTSILSEHKIILSSKFLTLTSLIFILIAGLFEGKTQVFFLSLLFIFIGSFIKTGNPINPLLNQLGFKSISKKKTIILFIVLLIIFIFIQGGTRYLRSKNMGDFSFFNSLESIGNYLSLPLINTEGLFSVYGWHFIDFNLKNMLINLLPNKLINTSYIPQNLTQYILEPTSPLGFVGDVYFNIGLFGLFLYCFFTGFISKYIYSKSFNNLFYLLVYSQISWTLIMSSTYNDFIYLIYIPLPTLFFFFLYKLLSTPV